MSNQIVDVQKIKGEENDFYRCRECGKTWKSSANKIGHSTLTCKRYHKKVYGWV